MKTRIFVYIPVFIVFTVVFASCTHTNELSKYKINSSKVLFKTYVSPNLAKADVHISTGYGNAAKSLFAVILGEIGSAYSEEQVKEKLRKAVNGDSLAESISSGIEDGLKTYCKVTPVFFLDENPDFVVETRLLAFWLSSGSGGIHANAKTNIIMTDRNTARTVWENSETSCVPLHDILWGYFGSQTVRTTESIINAVRLMNMTEEEIRTVINIAAEEVGRKQSETLREDLASR